MVSKCTCVSGDFKLFFEALQTVTEECRVHVKPTGFSAKGMSAANNQIVDVTFAVPVTKEDEPEDREIGLPVTRMKDLLNIVQGTETHVTVTNQYLEIVSGGASAKIRLLDPQTLRKEPNAVLDSPIVAKEVDGKKITETLKTVGDLFDTVRITAVPEGIQISNANSQCTDLIEKMIPLDAIQYEKAPTAPASSLYDWVLLKDITKVLLNKMPAATYQIGSEFPLIIVTSSGTISARFIVAPRIPSEEPEQPAATPAAQQATAEV